MNEHKNQNPDLDPSQELSKDLKAIFAPDFKVPTQIDRAIMDQAGQHLLIQSKSRRSWYWTAFAAAAMIAICALFLNLPDKSSKSPIDNAPIVKTDIDKNGAVNILDAFQLARSIKSQQPIDEKWDLNGDGVIDQKDVDSVAFAAVRLNEGVL